MHPLHSLVSGSLLTLRKLQSSYFTTQGGPYIGIILQAFWIRKRGKVDVGQWCSIYNLETSLELSTRVHRCGC
ncbi:hypothetical protein M378DRAFT_156108, partial [Amanita muscaria Koide BX008]